jgi:hypothetical protein
MEGTWVFAHVGGTRQYAGASGIKIGAAHKKKFEEWLRVTFEAEGIGNALLLARQILLLLDGSFAAVLLHRNPSHMETAGEAAFSLVNTASSRMTSSVGAEGPARGPGRCRKPSSGRLSAKTTSGAGRGAPSTGR